MKVYIWDTGLYLQEFMKDYPYDVCGFIESKKSKDTKKTVIEPYALSADDYDCIIVANSFTREIYSM